MKCTFYRPQNINTGEWNDIRRKLRADMDELEAGSVTESDAVSYLANLLSQAEPLEKNPAMRFFGFEKPENLPSDIRVEYYYWPTYLAASITMKACLLYPGILGKVKLPDGQSAEAILRSVLLGCTGRGFRGHGFDDVKGLVEVTEYFVEHGSVDFLNLYGNICPEFTECMNNALMFLLAGVLQDKVAGAWGDDYTDRACDILIKAGMLSPEEEEETEDAEEPPEEEPVAEERLYLAYGSNLNISQMQYRCPDAHVVGTSVLPGWRLMFKGSKSGNYLTIEMEDGYIVPVAVWAVSEQDEKNLDRYEGYPTFYYKRELSVILHEKESGMTRRVNAFAYIMHEERKLGRPTESYMERCREGYRAFGFDPEILDEAYEFSSGA